LIILGTCEDDELSRVTSAETCLGDLKFEGDYELETGVTRWVITQDMDLLASLNRKDSRNMINDAVMWEIWETVPQLHVNCSY
jgi:hypothetical protein